MFYLTMIVSAGLMVALFVSTTWSGAPGRKKTFPNYHGDSLGVVTGNSFSYKTVLETPKKGLQFAFILVRHGMVPPCDKSFEFDGNRHKFRTTWPPETPTERGNQLMTMVGRSLKTRYKTYLDELPWEQISVTTMNKDWAITTGEHLLQGLLHETKHKKVLEEQQRGEPSNTRINKGDPVDYDRFSLEASKQCSWLKEIMTELNLELSFPGNVVALKHCNDEFYTKIRKFVVNEHDAKSKQSMWWIKSPKQVFALWQVLWFEVQEGQPLFEWSKRNWANILACVFEYNRLQLDWHPDVAPILVGRMFNEIKEEKEEKKIKFHIHITDGTQITNFMWNLPENPRTLWLDYGDALILEFYQDESVSVSLFSGMKEKHETIHTYKYEELKNYFMEHGLNLTMEEYEQICNYNPKV